MCVLSQQEWEKIETQRFWQNQFKVIVLIPLKCFASSTTCKKKHKMKIGYFKHHTFCDHSVRKKCGWIFILHMISVRYTIIIKDCQNQENNNDYSYHCNYFIAPNRNNLTSFLRTEKTQGKRLKISNENMSTVTTIFWWE